MGVSGLMVFPGFHKKKQGRSPLGPNLLKMGASLCCYMSLDLYVVWAGGPLDASGNINGEFHGRVGAFGHLEVI